MKTCPNCNELVGDNAQTCFNCRYSFMLKRVVSSDEISQMRKEQQQKIDELSKQTQEEDEFLNINPIGRDKAVRSMILTTTNTIDRYDIIKYIDVISIDNVFGIGLSTSIKSLSSIVSSVTGSEVKAYTERLSELKKTIKESLKNKAYTVGANAVIGIDYETTIIDSNVIMITISGTAVKIIEQSNS